MKYDLRPGSLLKLTGLLVPKERKTINGWKVAEQIMMLPNRTSIEKENIVIEVVECFFDTDRVHIKWVKTGAELIVTMTSLVKNSDPITL